MRHSCIADRLSAARKDAGLDRAKAAVQSGRSYSSIAQYEQGRISPPLAVIRRLAQVYGVPMRDLIGDD